jgi:DNA-binding transcriptional LysR family regulator
MRKGDYSEFAAFVAVAEERSFTRAAARLGLSQSALSHAVKTLEARLGLRLLARTTRSLSLTDAGERLLQDMRPALDHIDERIAALTEFRDRPAGTIRLTTFRHVVKKMLWPAVTKLMVDYPDISVELSVNEGLVDIVTERFDAGIRFGEQVHQDMISVPISPDARAAVVASPKYLADRAAPIEPADLRAHNLINYRRHSGRGLFEWNFRREDQVVTIAQRGQAILNDSELLKDAALAGLGLAYVFEDQVAEELRDGKLIRVLEDWCPPVPGYHLYYPSKRHHTPAFLLLVQALRMTR